MEIVLYEPEIPPNTGNVARLCGAVDVRVWPDWPTFLESFLHRLVFTSARRGTPVHQFRFLPDDGLVFGPETRGCPHEMLDVAAGRVVNIPIHGPVRSLNLSTAAGIVLYEAMRQTARCGRHRGC